MNTQTRTDLKKHLDEFENPEIKIYIDPVGIPTTGIGHALVIKSKGKWVVEDPLPSVITEADKKILEKITEMLDKGATKKEISDEHGSSFTSKIGVDEVDKLLDEDIKKHHELGINALSRRLNIDVEAARKLYNDLPEKAKLTFNSLSFNNPGALIGPGISQAIQENNLAKVFYEVASNSDAQDKDIIKGIRRRRFIEGKLVLEAIEENGVSKKRSRAIKRYIE